MEKPVATILNVLGLVASILYLIKIFKLAANAGQRQLVILLGCFVFLILIILLTRFAPKLFSRLSPELKNKLDTPKAIYGWIALAFFIFFPILAFIAYVIFTAR